MNIENLYAVMRESEALETSFYSPEEDKAYSDLKRYIEPLEKIDIECFRKFDALLLEFSEKERYAAFKLGFKTAAELIMSALEE